MTALSKPTASGNLLQQRIDEKITGLKAIEQDSPSVIIVHSLETSGVVYMSPNGLKILEVTLDELIAIGPDYHPRFFNMEFAESYVPKIFGLIERNNNDEAVSFVQQVRSSPEKEWTWYLSCTRIFLRDEKGKPVLTISNAIPLDADLYIDAAKAHRLMEENSFLRKNYHVFDALTKREKQILQMMASGTTVPQMAKQLHISEATAATHRRNIKSKLKIKTNYDVTRFAQAFNLI